MHIATADMTIGVLLLNQLLALRDAGFEVVAICSPGSYVGAVERAGIRVIPVAMARAVTPLEDVKSLLQLWWVLRRERPDIIHTHTPKAGLLGQYAALLAGVTARIHTIHGLYFPGHMSRMTRPLYVWLERLTMRYTDMALSQNPEDIPLAVAERICRADRIRYLGNGIDLSRFDPARIDGGGVRIREELGLAPGDQVVGIVGRVNSEKGYREFFQAGQEIAKRQPRAHFLVVGPVEREKSNALDPHELAREHGLSDRTHYVGTRSDMPQLYAAMDVLVLPSHREGFPRAPMEASAMCRPVVATNIRGCRQVVRDGETGFLVPPRQPEALAGAVLRLLSDRPLAQRMGECGRVLALREFDERQVIQRTIDCYRELLGQGRKAEPVLS